MSIKGKGFHYRKGDEKKEKKPLCNQELEYLYKSEIYIYIYIYIYIRTFHPWT